jgi:RHS repeat-associated protein
VYYENDGLGNSTDLTDSNGNWTAARTWDAFGVQKSGGVQNFLGGYGAASNYVEDRDSTLKLCGARYYDSSIGRFLSSDPAGFGRNFYSYCSNNPLSFSDPSGLTPYNICDGSFDNPRNGGSDNDSGWWDGNGLNFSEGALGNGARTGGAGLLHGITFGAYDGGDLKNEPGFGFATGCGYVVDACAIVYGGSLVAARVTAQGAAATVATLGTAAAADEELGGPDLVAIATEAANGPGIPHLTYCNMMHKLLEAPYLEEEGMAVEQRLANRMRPDIVDHLGGAIVDFTSDSTPWEEKFWQISDYSDQLGLQNRQAYDFGQVIFYPRYGG